MRLLEWFRRIRQVPRGSATSVAAEAPRLTFEGGDGETPDKAIIVRGARFDLEGTAAEFTWLTQNYGWKDQGWNLVSHSHGKLGDRDIDTFEIQLADGTPRTVYFDCTESFGKWPESGDEFLRT